MGVFYYIYKGVIVEFISSKDNPTIKLFTKLSDNKKFRQENNMFVLEGLRLCCDAAKENAELYCVLITTSALEKYSEALDLLKSSCNKILYITDELGKKLSDTGTTQGIFAICRVLDKTPFTCTIKNNAKYIVLDNLQDPGNIGTIIRTADAVGIDEVIMCRCCDLYNPKVIRSTMGSIFRIPIIINNDIEEIISLFNQKNVISYASVIDSSAINLTECNFSGSSAVIIGNEGQGLSEHTVDLCNKKLTIKMKGNVNSFNAAMAAGIIMWEMLR